MRQMPIGAVKVIGQIGAALATFFPARPEHEMIDNQLTATLEQIGPLCFPSGPSKTYCFSTFTIGSLRRAALSASRWRVNSFSRVSKSFRAISHSASGTISVCLSINFIFVFLWIVVFVCFEKIFQSERSQASAGCYGGSDQRC